MRVKTGKHRNVQNNFNSYINVNAYLFVRHHTMVFATYIQRLTSRITSGLRFIVVSLISMETVVSACCHIVVSLLLTRDTREDLKRLTSSEGPGNNARKLKRITSQNALGRFFKFDFFLFILDFRKIKIISMSGRMSVFILIYALFGHETVPAGHWHFGPVSKVDLVWMCEPIRMMISQSG